jgi:exodeoxyribonuclease V alpha subunit
LKNSSNNTNNKNSSQQLKGTVERIIYESPETGFQVFVVANSNISTIVKGYMPTIKAGQEVTLCGAWIFHPKFGKQFEASNCIAQLPTTIVGLQKYLSSGMIRGIGPVYAEKLISAFGIDVLKIIDEQPDKLALVGGIGPKRIQSIIAAWNDQKEIANIMVYLQDKGVSPAFALKIYKKYGQTAVQKIEQNPYQLADDIWGISFKTADAIAQKIGFEFHSIKRVKAGIIFTISTIIDRGHLYINLDELKTKSLELLNLEHNPDQLIKQSLHDLYHEEKIKLVSHNQEHLITLSQYYFSEKGVAQRIQRLSSHRSGITLNPNAIYNQLRRESVNDTIQLNDAQQQGIVSCVTSKISIITGGPGTGKTTLIKKLLYILDENNVSYKLAAPTGRAAKRMMEGTGKFAMTLHRLLEFDVSTMQFTKNEQETIVADVIIIDEASMIDIFLANALFKAIPLNAHVVFIGDVDQLPSVGAGNFLNDLISSKTIPCIKLIEIFRQARDSLIIVNAHRINNGEFPVRALPDSKKDFLWIKEEQPETICNHLAAMFKETIARHNISPHNTMVLVPMNRGTVGTQNINHTLQSILNPISPDIGLSFMGTVFKPNDRVMQIKNNYDKNIFNGDIGLIQSVDLEGKTISVSFGNTLLEYHQTELDELVLAYAISIHKSQGSEFDAVIVPIFIQHFTLLQRNLIYTAITRAKKLCIFIGQTKAIAIGIKNNKSIQRKTLLSEFLTSDVSCR